MKSIHTNGILSTLLVSYWGLQAFGSASVVCSFMIADVGKDEQAFMCDCLILLSESIKILQR